MKKKIIINGDVDITEDDKYFFSNLTIRYLPYVNQEPYKGIIRNIPSTIQAEDYDLGGEDVAFHVIDIVEPISTYRVDTVNLQPCFDVVDGNNIHSTKAGEWFEYAVNVLQTSRYIVKVRVASITDNRTIHLELDDLFIGKIDIPNTGGLQTWKTACITTPILETGVKCLKIVFDQGDVNLNQIQFTNR